MKKILLLTLTLALPLMVSASKPGVFLKPTAPSKDIPVRFLSSSETSILEWGCPVSELVNARSKAEALNRIGEECMEEAKRQATNRPGVFEVIEANVIFPDVLITEEAKGYRLQGTFFLETLVLQGAGGIPQ